MQRIKLATLGAVCLLLVQPACAEEVETAASSYYAGFYAGYGKTHDSTLRIEGYPPGTLLFEPITVLAASRDTTSPGRCGSNWTSPGAQAPSTGLKSLSLARLARLAR